jgi:dolichol-phosphate mannosyltransferase
MSKTATILSRIYTKIKDPMSGFFLIKKECLKGAELNPRGFKILLEVIIKGKYKKVKEIPITFTNRTKGKSKAGTNEIVCYIQNLLSYVKYKNNLIKEFLKFSFVGAIGTLINLTILYLLTEKARMYYIFSAIFAFILSMTSNFILNKIWTFKENLKSNITQKYLKFTLVSITALTVNLLFLYIFTEVYGIYYLISLILAIGIALVINFLGNKLWTFGR